MNVLKREQKFVSSETTNNGTPLPVVPHQIGIIMDGNGRWAQAKGWPRSAGHQAGVDNIRRILESCVTFGVKVLTIYAFSTENWQRPARRGQWVDALVGLNDSTPVE